MKYSLTNSLMTFSVFAIAVFSVTSCSKKEEKKASKEDAGVSFLTPQALLAGPYTELSAAKVTALIQDDGIFYLSEPSISSVSGVLSTNEVDSYGKCISEKMDDVPYQVNGDTIITSFSINLARACAGGSGVKEATVKGFTSMRCKGADFSYLRGKKIADVKAGNAGNSFKCDQKDQALLVKSSSYSVVVSGSSTIATKTEFYNGKENGEACDHPTGSGMLDNCVYISKQVTDIDIPADAMTGSSALRQRETIIRKMEMRGLQIGDKADKYYSGGKMAISINGWEGEMSYTGKEQAPTFSLKQDDKKAVGTYGVTSEDSEL